MDKIASPQDLQAELRSLMAFVHEHGPDGKPDRHVIAAKLRDLADRVAGGEPFEGQGWGEQKKWLQEAKRATPKTVTPQRATQIMQQARAKAQYGPWSDQLMRVMTQGEYRFVSDVWDTLPGNTSFVTALETIAKGKAASLYRNNMDYNRSMAMKLFNKGWTPEQIAQGWPMIWKAKDGKLGKAPGVTENTKYSMAKVDEAMRMGPEKFLARK